MNSTTVNSSSEFESTESKSQPNNSINNGKKNFRNFSDNAWKNQENIGFPFGYYLNNKNNNKIYTNNNYNMCGIVHQFENNFFDENFQKQDDSFFNMSTPCYSTQQHNNNNNNYFINDNSLTIKCSCCRKFKNELVCGLCCSNKILKLNTIRERRRALFLNKAQLCLAIEKQLENEINFENEYYKRIESINKTKTKIAFLEEFVQKLKEKTAKLEEDNKRGKKYMDILQTKTEMHETRINEMYKKMQLTKTPFENIQNKLNNAMLYTSIQLLQIFKLQQFEIKPVVPAIVWGFNPTKKRHFYKINDWKVDDLSSFDKLISELFSPPSTPTFSTSLPSFSLFNSSPINPSITNGGRKPFSTSLLKPLSVESRQTMIALLYASQLIEAIAAIINIYLPYFNINKKLLKSVNWTREEFVIYLFRLKYSILILCLWIGVPADSLDLSNPFANLYNLRSFISKNGIKIVPADELFLNLKHRNDIIKEYRKVIREVGLENIDEEDWVNINMI